MNKQVRIAALVLGTALLGACSQTQSPPDATVVKQTKSMTVEVLYKDRSMQPPGSELTVSLIDVSRMDAPATVITSKTMALNSAPPYSVELTYPADSIQGNMRYSVRAQITQNGELRYTTTQNNDPFGVEQNAELVKVMMQRVAKPNEALVNTYWKAKSVGDENIEVKQREPQITLHNDGRVTGFLGCNQISGDYVKGQHFGLRFGTLAMTKKMCFEFMEQEGKLNQALIDTFSYHINGDTLTLKNEQGSPLASFKAVHMQ
ncbi:META domain-containing protein [Pseudoalteromonas sp. SSDWG2]|uniref:META domain-containing protein n=1 Tax=Pseudoalteromonas sp. SSDWG2 TaxID=3139391 RepID=UPI003BACEC8D